ncbi:MAG TPA: DUF4242 domain-containing protein [Burkholderiales bacterium]|nr:DUF4242 domain-containing protein [Burkholderiales bacterium]
MPKFVIERDIPGAGNMTPEQIREGANKSNLVIRELGSDIKWIHSFVTGDKLYCVFVAPDEHVIREHARCAGMPANRISRVAAVIDPASGEQPS